MQRFIGLDVHASSSTFGVMDAAGKRLGSQVVETHGEALVGYLKVTPGELHLCLEEGTQSSWLVEVLSPHVHELVVVGLGREKQRGPKDDKRDAFALADMLRKNDVPTRVYKKLGPFARLRELVKVHTQVGRDVVCERPPESAGTWPVRGSGPPEDRVEGPGSRGGVVGGVEGSAGWRR